MSQLGFVENIRGSHHIHRRRGVEERELIYNHSMACPRNIKYAS